MSTANFNFEVPTSAIDVTKSDSAQNKYSMLYVGGAGDVKITDRENNVSTFVGVPAGSYIYVQTNLVWSTGTTATSIVGIG
jgi:hypothetical protein